jgi:hypothetical protein
LFVIDVDGTLLTDAHAVAAGAAAQLRRVRDAGVEVLLASSRGPRVMLPVLTAAGRTRAAAPSAPARWPHAYDRSLDITRVAREHEQPS